MNQDYLTLNDGNKIPQVGLGVFQIPEDEDAKKACLQALSLGYRHIDTAHHYHNERGVGRAVKESGLERESLWITSKLWPNEYGDEAAVDKMLARLDMDYLDLLLLHQQVGDYAAGWRGLEKAVADGKVRSIGLSNFETHRLEDILAAADIPPAILQVECHPYYQQMALKKRVEAYGTKIACWFPIGHGNPELINEAVFTALAKKYGKTNVQMILRWHVQEGHVVIPKSTNPLHLKENIELFDFELTAAEMDSVRAINRDESTYNRDIKVQEEKYLNIVLDD